MKLISIFGICFAMLLGQTIFAADSMCTASEDFVKSIDCPSSSLQVKGSYLTRTVKFALPKGTAPENGWPTVVIYQGSFFAVGFSGIEGMPFGGFNQIRLIQDLLDHGFAVIAPPAMSGLAWETNLVGVTYKDSEDDIFLNNLLAEMKSGKFGPIDMNNLFATGISSGGYETSRMAISMPGVFKALAIESASYATCGGALCFVPDDLPVDHPPTMFLHGEADMIVPISTMWSYYKRLKVHKVPVSAVVDKTASHQWIDQAPDSITSWFLNYKN